MPIYVYRCANSDGGCGVRFERLLPFGADAPDCPACDAPTHKLPAGFSLGGQASAGLAKEQMPQTWRGLYNGDREYVTRMQHTWEQRQKLETRHPELAGDQRPILAHEGRYHDTPLRAGDQPGHGHGHGGHDHGGDAPVQSSGGGGQGRAPGAPGDKPAHDRRLGAKSGQNRGVTHRVGDHGRPGASGGGGAGGAPATSGESP